jgi:hypothetical protein
MLVAVDPGRDAGVAVFDGGRLVCNTVVRRRGDDFAAQVRAIEMFIPSAAHIVAERMVPRRGRFEAADDLVDVTLLTGMLVKGKVFTLYRPEQWKGQLSKDVQHAKMMRVLDPEELSLLSPDHNARDAVGIGLYHLGRGRR